MVILFLPLRKSLTLSVPRLMALMLRFPGERMSFPDLRFVDMAPVCYLKRLQ